MKYRFAAFAAGLILASMGIPRAARAQNELNPASGQEARPDGRGNRNRETPPRHGKSGTAGAVVTGNGINFNGGPVMRGAVSIYYIWYGDWLQDPNANVILTDWANSIGGSPYEIVNSTYGDPTGNVSGAITYGGSTDVSAGTFGTSLSDSDIGSIVSNSLTTGALPTDANGVYLVLTAPGVNETSGFLTQYCGWHTYGYLNVLAVKYAFVGDAAGPKLGSCAAQTDSSPNGDSAADGMVSVIAHEVEETTSDPNLNAWYDSSGAENADKCAWTFGTTYSANGGGVANMKLGARDFLIQQNWLNANGGYCALSYSATPDFSLSVSPASQSLPSTGGTTSKYTITETTSRGFSNHVSYSVSSLPPWAYAVFSGSTFTVIAKQPVPGTYGFTITGTSGSLVHSIAASLVIRPPAPTYTISISPVSQSVTRGQSVSYVVTISPQNGFTGTVALTPGGAKTGLQVSLSSPSETVSDTNSITATLTAATSASARKATDTLTVTGTSGTLTKSASASLRIN